MGLTGEACLKKLLSYKCKKFLNYQSISLNYPLLLLLFLLCFFPPYTSDKHSCPKIPL